MFVLVTICCVRVGEEDAMIALHENWRRHQQVMARGFISSELLRTVKGSREFLAIMRFESRECAQACMDDPGYQLWYRCVASLSEEMPVFAAYNPSGTRKRRDETFLDTASSPPFHIADFDLRRDGWGLSPPRLHVVS